MLANVLSVVGLAIGIEAAMEIIKKLVPDFDYKTQVIQIATMILGIIGAITLNVDLFCELGVTSEASLYCEIITGIIIGGGSSIVYDVIERIKNGIKSNSSDSDDEEPQG